MATKTVLITGTSTGIGAACVARQARDGWRVYAGVRKEEDGERLASSIDGDVVPVILDVTKPEDITRVVSMISEEVGHLDGLVNNAGILVGGPVELLSDEDWRWQFDVNFFSFVALTNEAMPLVDKANGRFVHIGSIGGRIGMPGASTYSASKHAVAGFNWSLRAELRRNTKMNSSVVEPGEVKTAIFDKAADILEDVDKKVSDAGLTDRYGWMIDSNRAFIKEGNEKGVDPDKVAKAVQHALTSRRPKARYLVGPDGKAIGLISRLPDRLQEGLMAANTKRYIKAGRKLD